MCLLLLSKTDFTNVTYIYLFTEFDTLPTLHQLNGQTTRHTND